MESAGNIMGKGEKNFQIGTVYKVKSESQFEGCQENRFNCISSRADYI